LYSSDFLDKEIKIKRKSVNFAHYFVWSYALRKELRIMILDKILVRKIFLNKRWEETEQLRGLYEVELA
jgi:hypothetical protein